MFITPHGQLLMVLGPAGLSTRLVCFLLYALFCSALLCYSLLLAAAMFCKCREVLLASSCSARLTLGLLLGCGLAALLDFVSCPAPSQLLADPLGPAVLRERAGVAALGPGDGRPHLVPGRVLRENP